jgi:hypothetical protein
VEGAVEKLLETIRLLSGVQGRSRECSVTFGQLFTAYENISDTLVGIMVRAKRRGLIQYDGEMLFQGIHDNVRVTLKI